jgi:hypothetical protein
MAATVATLALAILLIAAAPGLAQAESLSISLGGRPTLGEPLGVVAEGEADGSHGLFVYLQPGGQTCAFDPAQESSERLDVVTLSSAAGDPLGAGAFARTYDYTPEAENTYSVCVYLDQLAADPPDAIGGTEFAIPSGPVEVPTLKQQEELKRVAVEHQEELERTKRLAEQAERERPLPTAVHPPEAPPAAPVAKAVRCDVPSLRGHSLAATRTALRRSHCKLGAVKRPSHAHGTLVVVRQSVKRGSKLRDGAAVAVVLGAVKRSH